jgi:hypothetical protein
MSTTHVSEDASPQVVDSERLSEATLRAASPPTNASRRARPSLESAIQIVIMLAIGIAAGAAGFTHVHDVTATHGQGGWKAWADAVDLETHVHRVRSRTAAP